jgi:tetratricopeptide (TPR) repeat protein
LQESLALGHDKQGYYVFDLVLLAHGDYAWATRQYAQAVHWYNEVLTINKATNNKEETKNALCGLAKTALVQGDLTAARDYLAQALAVYGPRPVGEFLSFSNIILDLQIVITLAIAGQQMAQATRLLSATEALYNLYVTISLPADRQQRENNLAATRLALGGEVFAAVWAESQALTLEQALALALEVLVE